MSPVRISIFVALAVVGMMELTDYYRGTFFLFMVLIVLEISAALLPNPIITGVL